jgi:hypothetical protein
MARIKMVNVANLCHICGHWNWPLVKVTHPINPMAPEDGDTSTRICANCLNMMSNTIMGGIGNETPPAPPILAIVNGEPLYKK